jgi:hypothetical protein
VETIEDTLGESAETAAPGAASPTPRADAMRGIVPGLLGEGLTRLAGDAKTGKSWPALDLLVERSKGRR